MDNIRLPELFCKSKIPNGSEGYVYYIAYINNINNVDRYTREEVKRQLELYPGSIANLKLSSDGKVIDRDFNKELAYLNKYIGFVDRMQNRKYITVGELTDGHVVNQDVFVPYGGLQESGEIKEEGNSLIAGNGYILNENTVQNIKQHYGPECILHVMEPGELKRKLKTDYNLRRRLAAFYSQEMKNARYMHLERIKNNKSRRIYDYVVKELISFKFLNSDPNLLYVLFNLYGYHMYTFEHSVDVAIYACMIYGALYEKMDKEYLTDLFIAGLLHDTGKMKVSCTIIDSKNKLEGQDLIEMKKHPVESMKIVRNLCKCSSPIFNIYRQNEERRNRLINGVLYHHAKFSVKATKKVLEASYPEKLTQETLNEKDATFCAIISIADCLDGMLSPRPYRARKGVTPLEGQRKYIGIIDAIQNLKQDAIDGKLDKSKVRLLEDILNIDPEYDFDDIYGIKISNIVYDESLSENYTEIK